MREQLGDQAVSTGGAQARPGFTPTGERIGRNDPCWCGSGKKFKKCHGA
jgi:preprotein translocase subunit SecA